MNGKGSRMVGGDRVGIICIGADHNCASIELRSKVSFTESKYDDVYEKLKKFLGIDVSIIISTCNRTEIYAFCDRYKEAKTVLMNFIKEYFGLLNEEINKFYFYEESKAIEHLFRVAAGLESMVIGEDQILGQVKEAHERAMDKGASNAVLNRVFRDAITCAKEIKSQTGISSNKLSLASIAIETLKGSIESLENKSALVVGAGDMSRIAINCLLEDGIKAIYICNRSFDSAKDTINKFPNTKFIDFTRRYEVLNEIDILITATSAPHNIFEYEKFRCNYHMESKNKLFIIDMAVPKDVDPEIARIDKVALYDVDYFKEIAASNLKHREELKSIAESMISEYIEELEAWLADRNMHELLARIDEYTDDFVAYEADCLAMKHNYKHSMDINAAKNYATTLSNRILKKLVLKLKYMDYEDKVQCIKVLNQLTEK
jgi:glutamyl-tRNA reductase